jgi:hypothetical protein
VLWPQQSCIEVAVKITGGCSIRSKSFSFLLVVDLHGLGFESPRAYHHFQLLREFFSESHRNFTCNSSPVKCMGSGELFFIRAEDGKGITKSSIDIAIKKYHAKQGQLEVKEAEAKAKET